MWSESCFLSLTSVIFNLLSDGMRGLEKTIASKNIYVLKSHKISHNKETFLKIKSFFEVIFSDNLLV
jgi:hypothetical protein